MVQLLIQNNQQPINPLLFHKYTHIQLYIQHHMTEQPILTILHFNDVYDIQQRNGHGGIVNFKANLQALKQHYPNSIVLFSGDAFSPSILSTIKEGWQMLHCLNQLEIDAACYGNHEFDYKHQHLIDLKNGSNFPWLLGNLTYLPTGTKLGQAKQFTIIQKFGLRIGVFGIAGDDWPGILPAMYYKKVLYEDHIQYSNKLCKKLRQQYNCNFIVALTHMRNGPDCLYPSKVKGVDVVLGGHDHVVLKQFVDNVPVIKSGTNFLSVGVVNVFKQYITASTKMLLGRRYNFQFDVLDVRPASEQKIDRQLKKYVHQLLQQYKKYDQIVGYTEVDLDMTFVFHRRNESTYGNFLADLYRLYVDADVAFANSGNIRNDCVLEKGQLWFSDVKNIIEDHLVVKELTGKEILAALELSVDSLPLGTKGSFLQVSGIKFQYSTKRPPGSRVKRIWVDGKAIKLKQKYSVVMISYIANGGDNYTFLKKCPVVKDPTQTIVTTQLVHQFFTNINYDHLPQQVLQDIEIKPQSDALKRVLALQYGLRRNEYGNLIPTICPKIQGRIVDITEKDDFGSYKFLFEKQQSLSKTIVQQQNAVQMRSDDYEMDVEFADVQQRDDQKDGFIQ